MTVAKAQALADAVKATVEAAVVPFAPPSIGVFTEVPKAVPQEHVRLDGFDIFDASYKAEEQGRHSFEIHHFDRPVGRPVVRDGKARSRAVLAAVHAALMASRPAGGLLRFETLTIGHDMDGVTAHGIARYTILLR